MQLKGTLLKYFFNNYLIFPSTLHNFLSTINFKEKYSDINFLNINENTNSFINNNSDFIVYSVPNMIALWVIFLVLFKVTYRMKVSKLFRKYSLFAVVLFMIFEGNI